MSRILSAAAGLSVGALLFWLALRGAHPDMVLGAVRRFEWEWTPVLLLLPVADLWLRALRWRLLLSHAVDARPWVLFKLEAVGLCLNNLLFMRLGELARAVLGGIELETHAFSVLATILIERLCDAAALFALFAVVPGVLGVPVERSWGATAAVLAAAGVAAIAAAALSERWLVELSRQRLARWPRAAHLASDLAAGAGGLRSPGAWWRVAGLSLGLWLLDAGMFWSSARALDLEPELGFGRAVVLVTGAAASTSLPAAPGAFGNFEAAVKWLLVRFGTEPGAAFAYAAFTHLVMYTVVTGLGIVFLYRLGHTMEGLKRAVEALSHARHPGGKT